MTLATDRFGPWAEGIDPAERLARLLSLRAIVRLTTSSRGEALADELHRAKRDASRLPVALQPIIWQSERPRREWGDATLCAPLREPGREPTNVINRQIGKI